VREFLSDEGIIGRRLISERNRKFADSSSMEANYRTVPKIDEVSEFSNVGEKLLRL